MTYQSVVFYIDNGMYQPVNIGNGDKNNNNNSSSSSSSSSNNNTSNNNQQLIQSKLHTTNSKLRTGCPRALLDHCFR